MALRIEDPFLASPPLPHERLRNAVTARRVALLKLGYEPIPILSGRKRPAMNGWQDVRITIPPNDEDVITPWADTYPGALSTGIRTRYTPGFDIDIRDQDVADEVQQALLNLVPSGTILKRIGQAPKRLIPLRCTTPFKKISTTFKAPDGTVHKVEVLADGQQFVAEGIHETTQQPYRWADNVSLLDVAHEHLPLVDEALARRFVAAASEIMRHAAWVEVGAQGKPKGNGKPNGKANGHMAGETAAKTPGGSIYGHTALRAECDKLAAMPKDSGRNNALNTAAFNLFQLVAGGELDEEKDQVRERLFAAAEACGLVAEYGGAVSVRATIESGAKAGRAQPRRAPDGGGKQHAGDETADETADDASKSAKTEATEPLVFINIVAWKDQPIPEREWAVRDRIPARAVTLLSGDGGVGKTILALHLGVATVLGRDWLSAMPEPGPVLGVLCEDDESEIHRRLARMIEHYGASFTDLADLHLMSLAGHDALLAAPNHRTGLILSTKLFERVQEAACDLRPRLILLDNSADVFGGNENDRAQVRQFIGLLRGLAIASGAAVLLTSHPSLTGMNTGSGLSGSTAWNASVRSRLYLKRAATEKDEEPDPDLRVVEVMKANYGPAGETITVRWKDGLFLPVPAPEASSGWRASSG